MVKRKGNKWILVVVGILLLIIISLIVISQFLPKKVQTKKFQPPISPATPPLEPFPLPDEFPEQGCNGVWYVGFPCENAFDKNWDTYTSPAAGHISYVYKKFQIPISAKETILKVKGHGEIGHGRDCGFKVFFYNFSNSNYTMLVNDTSTNTLTHELNIPLKDLKIEEEEYLLNIVIQAAYYPGSCGTGIHEMEIDY